ncbi:MAG: DUF1460 domain-containing protein [Saprospiraceae bacterium]|nr:DUF1460 domain-containing protein [Saprospiraceae bacterium]
MIHIFFLIGLCCRNEIYSQRFIEQNDESAMADCIIEHGKNLLGSNFEANTLDIGDEESLTFFKDRFDCITFVEYVLAMSLSQVKGNHSFEFYLQQLRYRNGVIAGYGSRLHYFSEWIIQNQKQGLIKDITLKIGGIKRIKKINFISKHKKMYPHIKSLIDYEDIKTSENVINHHSCNFIPKAKVKKSLNFINGGDIIAITTDKPGLDFVHAGIAVKVENKLYLLHASKDEKKVVISKLPLVNYLNANRNQSGIVVLRAQ